jgi:hypothetical protein
VWGFSRRALTSLLADTAGVRNLSVRSEARRGHLGEGSYLGGSFLVSERSPAFVYHSSITWDIVFSVPKTSLLAVISSGILPLVHRLSRLLRPLRYAALRRQTPELLSDQLAQPAQLSVRSAQ